MKYKNIFIAIVWFLVALNGEAMETGEEKSRSIKRKLDIISPATHVLEKSKKHQRVDKTYLANDGIFSLPDELLCTLFSFLDYQSLLNIGMTAKKNRLIAETPALWRALANRERLSEGFLSIGASDRYAYQFLKHPNLHAHHYLKLAHFNPQLPFITFQLAYVFLAYDDYWGDATLQKILLGKGRQAQLLNFEDVEVTLTSARGREIILRSFPKHIASTSKLHHLRRTPQYSDDFSPPKRDKKIDQEGMSYSEKWERESTFRREKRQQQEIVNSTLTFAYSELPIKVDYKIIYYSERATCPTSPAGTGTIFYLLPPRFAEDIELKGFSYDINKSIPGGEITAELLFSSQKIMPKNLYLIYNPDTYKNYQEPGYATIQVNVYPLE